MTASTNGSTDNVIALADAMATNESTADETQKEALVRIGSQAELTHDNNGETYLSAVVNGHRETWLLKSKAVREHLAYRYYCETGKVPGSQSIQDALTVLHGRALHDGEEKKTYVRIAHVGDKAYLDLADEERHIIEIRAGSWSYVTDAPVRFRRPKGMRPLPMPQSGGSLDELKQFVNIAKPSYWQLVTAWIVSLFFPGPFAWLALQGRQGTAKTSTSRALRQVIDPNKSPVRAPPRSVRDLVIGAANSVILVLDNLSYLDEELSDALCRMSTGGGLSTRELYSDLDEVIVEVQRAGILNGITDVVARGDLLDRCILIELPPIPKGQRKTEAQMAAAFTAAWPRMLGAILDTVAATMSQLPHVTLDDPPRMADFAFIGVAVERALGWPPGTFLAAYNEAITAATDVAIDVSVIAPYVKKVAEAGGFEGTATELLERLNDTFDGRWPRSTYWQAQGTRYKQRPEGWPKSPKAVSSQLRRLEPTLLAKGIVVTFTQTQGEGSKKVITIRMAAPTGGAPAPAPSTPASPASPASVASVASQPSPSTPVQQAPFVVPVSGAGPSGVNQ
jgi:hypothetical protein